MFLVVEALFIILMTVILFIFYVNERSSGRKNLPRAVMEECWSGKERRQHIRFKKNLEVNYLVRKRSRVKTHGSTVDVSQGGMKLCLSEKLAKGTVLELMVNIPDVKKAAVLQGEVVWSEDTGDDAEGRRAFYSGVMFISAKDPSRIHLIEYIKSLE